MSSTSIGPTHSRRDRNVTDLFDDRDKLARNFRTSSQLASAVVRSSLYLLRELSHIVDITIWLRGRRSKYGSPWNKVH